MSLLSPKQPSARLPSLPLSCRRFKTLTLNVKATIKPCDRDNERAPDFRVTAGGVEFGAGWTRTARETGAEHLSLKLDDPSFTAPVYATLAEIEGKDGYQLIWSRSNRDGGNWAPGPPLVVRPSDYDHRSRPHRFSLRAADTSLRGAFYRRPISPGALLPDNIEKQGDRLLLAVEVMDHRLAPLTDPSPAPRQAGLSKQRPLDRQGIEPGHVPACVGSFDIEMVGLTEHGSSIADAPNPVQRVF